MTKLQEEAQSLKEQLCSAKKLKGKPKIQPSTLNQKEKKTIDLEQRPGSWKRSKKNQDLVDEERVIEPVELPEGARFNGYRQYDVQDVIIKRHSIRFLLAEYVTTEGKTIVGKLPQEYQGHRRANVEIIYLVPTPSMPSAPELNRGTVKRTRHRYFHPSN